MFDNDLTPIEVSSITKIPSQSIRGYLRKDYEMTDKKWQMIEFGMKQYKKQPTIISKVPQYIIQCLTDFDNTIVMKKKIKKKEQKFIDDLKSLGFNCRLYDTGEDHYVIENKERFPNTPYLLKDYKVIID
jgi:predicted Ser/Thr protein kinase